MKQTSNATRSRRIGRLMIVLIPFLLLVPVTMAQSGGSYNLSRWTVDGGGGTSEGGGYRLMGVAGQPDTGPSMSGSDYILVGGFWGTGGLAESPAGNPVYLPIITKND